MNYIMESPIEGRRIEVKTDRELTSEQLCWAGVERGMTVLDLGCAAGTTCRIMARHVGTEGRVIGVDVSRRRLDEAQAHIEHSAAIEYRCGSADALPVEDSLFDVAWSRFLFEYLDRPCDSLREMIRTTKPGGIVCVSDLDGNCIWHNPLDALLQDEIDAALQTLGTGFNPRIGLHLFHLFARVGLCDIGVDVRPYHVIAGCIDQRRREHWQLKLDGIGTALISRGWPRKRADALAAAYMEHLADPQAFSYSILISVRGRVPSSPAAHSTPTGGTLGRIA